MFGHSYFGATYYGPPYFGPAAGAVVPPVVVESSRYGGSGRYRDELYEAVVRQWEIVELRKRQQALRLDEAIRQRTQPAPVAELPVGREVVARATYAPTARGAHPLVFWKPDAVAETMASQQRTVLPMVEERYQKIVRQRDRKARNRRRAMQLIALLS